MRLISLTSDQPTFHPIRFNPAGLTLIIGDASKEREGSSNGVGKTLALGLIHHCLGANADKALAAAVPDWWFTLLFSFDGKEHVVSRTGNGKKILLNGEATTITALREWLNKVGMINIDQDIPVISFRSLFKRFARYTREDCLSPTKTYKETDFDALLRTLYLLGLDCTLAVSKRKNKTALDDTAKALKNWQQDDVLKDMFRAGAQPKVRAEWLDREIPRLKGDLEKFQVAEDYRALEAEAGELTGSIRSLEKRASILSFQLENIEKTLAEHPDISREDLLDLYQGLQQIFKPEALAHFESVEKFHSSLSINRRTRLGNDKLKLSGQLKAIRQEIEETSKLRDDRLQSLQGKRALDEYAAIARQLAELQEEQKRLDDFLNFASNLQEKAQRLRESKVEEDRLAAGYAATNPAEFADEAFKDLVEVMYPRVPSGIVFEANTGDNQIRYDLTVQIEGDDSDGINAAKIICFDWLIFTRGAHHSLGMLWHDNRLFADIDPGVRGRWFSFVHGELHRSGKQYIASLNTENYDAMQADMPSDVKAAIEKTVVATLRGDKAANKLLGIQFGKSLSK